jgi:hypothetical protein
MAPLYIRVTSLVQLSVTVYSGELARPKAYENGNENVIAIWFDLESSVKFWAQFLGNDVH